jgi:hypothetical protein
MRVIPNHEFASSLMIHWTEFPSLLQAGEKGEQEHQTYDSTILGSSSLRREKELHEEGGED